MDCGSKGCRFDSFFLPLYLFNFFYFYNYFLHNINKLQYEVLTDFIKNFYFITNYYALNELIWQEGFLIDFLQKKIADNWIKKFLIYSAYLFNERLVFDKVIKFYLDLIIWPFHKLSIFEFNNVANTLSITFIFLFFYFLIFLFFYLFIYLF